MASYFGMRKVHVGRTKDGALRPMINNEFVFQTGMLDQVNDMTPGTIHDMASIYPLAVGKIGDAVDESKIIVSMTEVPSLKRIKALSNEQAFA